MYLKSCLLLKFHLLPHPTAPHPLLWGSPTATFQFLEVARFLPALGIYTWPTWGLLPVVLLAASFQSHSQPVSLGESLKMNFKQWLKSSAPPHRLSTHAAHIIITSHSTLFISFSVRKPKLCLLGTCLSPLLDSELCEEGEDYTVLFTTATPEPSWYLALSRFSMCVCGWMTRIF